MAGQQEVNLDWLPEKSKDNLSWLPDAPKKQGMILPESRRTPLEVPKRPGILPIIGETLKKTGQQIIAPVEAGVRMAAGIPAFLASTAATLGGQAITGDWEKGAEIGGKVGNFLGGGGARIGGDYTAKAEEMMSPLMAPLNIAMEQGPEMLAPNEPKTQAMLGSGMALALVLAPKLGVTPKTLIREARMTFWKDKSIPAPQKAAIIADLNKAEESGAKTMADVVKEEPPVGPKIKTEVPKPPVERRDIGTRPTKAAWDKRDYISMDDAGLKKIEANIVKRFDPEEVAMATAELDRRMEVKVAGAKAGEPVKPLSITSNQMKLGLEDFNKTMAEQGEGLLGEPRGGGIPVGMLKKPGESPLTVELPKRVGPINLERLDVGTPVQKLVADMEDRITMSRVQSGRKNVPWSESEAMANSMGGAYEIGQVLGKTAEEVLTDFGKSTKNLEAKVEATRTIFKTAIAEAQKAAKEAIDNPSPLTEARAQMAYNRWALVQYSVGQGSGEIGRALNIHKKLARSKEMILTKNYARMLKELGHDTLSKEAMQLLASFDESNPIVAMKFLANARKATTKEKLFEVWINSLLANPATHIVNFTSNMLFEGMAPGERLLGAGVEFIKHPLKASKRELYFGEAAHSAVGALHGMREGLSRYVYTIKHGVAKSGVSKFEETGIAPKKAIKGPAGGVVRFPGTELMANDDFWKAIIYSDDIYAQAYRVATKEGLRGDIRKAKMAELIANPTEAMSEAANKAARVRTFQAELGKLGNDFMRMRSRPGVPGTALSFIFPFVRTPINVVKEGIKRTPFGIAGAKSLEGAERSMSIGREVAAISTAVLVAKLVSEGKITGSAPENKAEREALYNTGWRPYSIKIGDTYYGYGRLEPIATQFGVMADAYPVVKMMKTGEWTKVAAKIGTSFRNNISNKTFLTGMNDVINATTDPARYGELLIKRWATSLVPGGGLLGGVARAVDPEIKDARKVIDWYKARLPFLSKEVPSKLNVMGEPQKTGGNVLTRLLSPVTISKEANDPVYTELSRLGINIGPMNPVVGGKKMSAEQTESLLKEAGPEIKKAVSSLLASKLYRGQTDENKRKMLRSWITKTRAYQKGLFILREQ